MQQLIIVDGAPGSGKTTFGYEVARALTAKGRPTLAIDQDFFEEVRERPGRRLIAALNEAAANSDVMRQFVEQAKTILPDGRKALYETFAASSLATLRQGFSAVLMVNLRPNDRPFYDLTHAVMESYAGKPVEMIGVHLKADPETNLKRVMAREPKGFDFNFTFGRTKEKFLEECAAWSPHGPGYVPPARNSEYRNYETLVLDPFWPIKKISAALVTEYMDANPSGIITRPARRPKKGLLGDCLKRGLGGLDK